MFQFDNEDEEYDSDEPTFNTPKLDAIFKAFEATPRRHQIKRIRSSFHLDEKNLKQWDQKQDSPKWDQSPHSDSTSKDYDTMIRKINIEPRCIMNEAYKRVDVFGSSTAWIAVINNKILKIANLGDSTCMLLRYAYPENKSKILLKTEEQQHNFNAPFQLSKLPEKIKNWKGNGEYSSKKKFWKDKASDSVLYQWKINDGDIVIWATDGLFDNLFTHEIIKIVDSFMSGKTNQNPIQDTPTPENTPEFGIDEEFFSVKNAKRLAKELVKKAAKKSKSRSLLTPFGEKFDKSNIIRNNELLRWNGGKPDDICAVVGFIKPLDTSDFNTHH